MSNDWSRIVREFLEDDKQLSKNLLSSLLIWKPYLHKNQYKERNILLDNPIYYEIEEKEIRVLAYALDTYDTESNVFLCFPLLYLKKGVVTYFTCHKFDSAASFCNKCKKTLDMKSVSCLTCNYDLCSSHAHLKNEHEHSMRTNEYYYGVNTYSRSNIEGVIHGEQRHNRRWKLHRLIWIGHLKDSNSPFSQLPKDMIREITLFV